ncbi:MAG: phage head spike fiber domain-containing protein [Longimicrobiales bacterium]
MITRASILHYVDGSTVPLVGGDPVFARDSSAAFVDQANTLRTLARLAPRIEWVSIDGVLRPAVVCEPARVNRVPYSRDLSQWSNTNTTLTAGQLDARGTEAARLATATSNGGMRAITVAVVGDSTKAISMLLRKGSAAVTDIEFIKTNGTPAVRHRVRVTWSVAGLPTLSSQEGSGTLFPVRGLVGGWWFIAFQAAGVIAADTNVLRLYPAGTSASGSVYFDGAQVEDGIYATAMIDAHGAAVARAVDQLYWRNPFAAQAVAIYWDVVVGNVREASTRLWHIGKSDGSSPYLFAGFDSSGHVVTQVHNGTASQAAAVNVAAVQGDRLEGVSIVHPTGAPRTIVTLNGGAAQETGGSAPSGGLISSWSEQRWWVGSQGVSAVGRSYLRRLWAVQFAAHGNMPGTAAPDLVLAESRLVPGVMV